MTAAKMKQIDIDINVYKAIESGRLSFDENPNTILRRLLHLDVTPQAIPNQNSSVLRDGWRSNSGVFLPNGTAMTMAYNGIHYVADVHGKSIRAKGKKFKSLSGAANHLTGQSLNGWNYWFVQRPEDIKPVQAKTLRLLAKTDRQTP